MIKSRESASGHGPVDTTALQAKLTGQVVIKISNLQSLDMLASTALFDAINASSLRDECKQKLITAVDAKILDAPCAAVDSSLTQRNTNPESWSSAPLLEALQDQRKSLAVKLQILADYMTSLGINHPHEQTLKWWYAMVLAFHYTTGWPTYRSIFEHLEVLKNNVEASRKRWPFPVLKTYPKNPSQLPDEQYVHIFGSDIIGTVEIPRLAVIANHHIPLRKNSKLLEVHGGPPSTPSAPPPSPPANRGNVPAVPREHSNTAASSSADTPMPSWATELMGMLAVTQSQHVARQLCPHGDKIIQRVIDGLNAF